MPNNGIMCGNGGPFVRNGYCSSDQVCTGTTNQADAVDESNKSALCTKGKSECYDSINFAFYNNLYL